MNGGRERKQAGSHSVHQPISAHSLHGSCPPGSATYGPRETQGSHSVTRRISGRPSHGSCPSGRSTYGARVPESKFAWRPSAHFATLFIRNVPR